MKLKRFGKTGKLVSEVGMGTYYDPIWIASAFLGWRRGGRRKVEAVAAGLRAGMTLVDTAEIYRSEPLVAEALRKWKREDVFLATKVWSSHLHRADLLKAFEKSLMRLGTTYIDLYQVHWPNHNVPIAETMGAMQELVNQGKLGHVGVSNFTLKQIQEAQETLPKSELAAVQLDYSLVNREVESGILPYCVSQGIALLAYYPLGHGRLARDGRLDRLSRKLGRTKSQVALQWLARQEGVFPIPRASGPEHVAENAGSSGWELTNAEAAEIGEVFG